MIRSLAGTGAASLYAARYGGGQVAVFDPSGNVIEEILIPGANVMNVAFGGPGRRALVITEVETSSV
jgi:sugar lactone lactonase YvrE